MPKWVKKWDVGSHSTPGEFYVVSLAEDGSYGCSCPRWKFKRVQCGHIEDVLAGHVAPRGEEQKVEPVIVLANVREVTLTDDDRVLVPLMPIGDTHFEAALVYDLLQAGVRWGTVKKRYSLAERNGRQKIVEYVRARGRRIYGPLTTAPGLQTYEVVPVEED